jgi:hypothetical protein
MDLTGESYEQALDRLLIQVATERDPGKRKDLRRQINRLKSERTKPLKSAPLRPQRKVWWPSSCRGIVG